METFFDSASAHNRIVCALALFIILLQWQSVTAQDKPSLNFGTLADFTLVDNGLYSGTSRRGRPSGNGFLIYFTGDVLARYNYTGVFANGVPGGQGAMSFRNGDIHRGEYADGKPHGRGSITFRNGDRFSGVFINGRRTGQGVVDYRGGARREGEWKNNKLDGVVFYYSSAADPSPSLERWKEGVRVDDGHRRQTAAAAAAASEHIIHNEVEPISNAGGDDDKSEGLENEEKPREKFGIAKMVALMTERRNQWRRLVYERVHPERG